MSLKKSFTAAIGVFGALFAIAGIFVYAIFGEMVWLYTTLEILAVIQLSIFSISHFEMLKDISSQRSTKFGVNSLLMVVIFIAILSILNFILARHEIRVDLSDGGTFSLSPQTELVLEHLEHEVTFIAFFTEQVNRQGQANHQGRAKDLLKNYERHSPKVSYRIIDPDKKPGLAKQYGLKEYNKIVVESGGRFIIARDLSEAGLTSALIRTSRKTKKTFYFVEGHGEHGIEETGRDGYSKIREALEQEGFTVKKHSLLTAGPIPEDSDVLIIAGPKRPYTDQELADLRRYLNQNGQLFVAIDPMQETALESFFLEWGILLRDDIILDPGSGLGPAIPTINPDGYLPHEIVQNFNLASFFPVTRSVSFDISKVNTYRFSPFLQSGENTWLTEQSEGELTVDAERDQKGPIIFGGVVTSNTGHTDSGTEQLQQMRIVVVGDSDFGTNSVARAAGNGDLFQNIITWLADEGDLVSIRPQEIPTTTLLLNDKQMAVIFSVSVLILPIGIMSIGLVIWRKRRQL